MIYQVKNQKYLILILILGLLFCLLYFLSNFLTPQYYFNLSPSEPKGLYRRVPFYGQLKRGELVLIEVPPQARAYVYGRKWLPPGYLLLKNVGALPGDTYRIDDSAIFINEEYVGPISKVDSHGKPLPRLRGFFRAANGYFLPISRHIPNSFDGRYFGPVSYWLIRGKAIPIITY